MRGIPPNKLTVRQLRNIVRIVGQRDDAGRWSREQCAAWLETTGTLSGIGNFCRDLLRVVVGRTDEGYAVGLSYAEMLKLIQVHYPCSMADEKHLRWYATSMRAAGEMIPVYRERSKWKK